MASEVIKLNLIPKGEMPVFHASQFDTGRLITCELYRGEDAYDVPAGYTVELHCRKVDNNIVTMASTLINGNVVTFTSTEQLTACNGNNLCEVAILDEGYRIGTLNFILEVEVDPLKGGINSTSEIHNLESQIEDITTEIIGENYYDKSEVDDLLSGKADTDSVYTIGEVNSLLSGKANAADVYTKSQTDTLLNAKADSSDVYTKGQVDNALTSKANAADVYTKSQVDTALTAKANAADVYTKSESDTKLALKANAADVYTKSEVDNIILDIMPVDTASGATAEFNTQIAAPLVSVIADITASGGGGTPVSPIPIVGYSQADITANGDNVTITFGQTVYGGVLDVTRGKLSVKYGYVPDMSAYNFSKELSGGKYHYYSGQIPNAKHFDFYELSGTLCSNYPTVSRQAVYAGTLGCAFDNTSRFYIYNADFDNESTTATDVKNNMSGVSVAYELETPFDIDITPEVISAVVGENSVYSDTNGDTTVKFKDSIQHYIDNH